MSDQLQHSQGFSSGNPVFDALVTIICQTDPDLKSWDSIHEKLIALAEREPGGLRRMPGMLQAEGQLPTVRTS